MGIVRKSFRNLEACSRVGLISICLDKLPQADPVISDLLIQLLSVLTSYSITVKETKHFLRALRASNKLWVTTNFLCEIVFKRLSVLVSKFGKTIKCNARNAQTGWRGCFLFISRQSSCSKFFFSPEKRLNKFSVYGL